MLVEVTLLQSHGRDGLFDTKLHSYKQYISEEKAWRAVYKIKKTQDIVQGADIKGSTSVCM